MSLFIKDLSFSYGNKLIIKDFSFSFDCGKIYGLVGKNGVGKTTLAKIISGLLPIKHGIITVDNEVLKKPHKKIGYMFQNPNFQLFASTVYEELIFPYQIMYDVVDDATKQKIDLTIQQYNLDHLKDNFPLLLSMGEKQRLALACLDLKDSDYIIFDEPTTYLDNDYQTMFYSHVNQLKADGKCVVIITHDYELTTLFDQTITLEATDG